MYSNDIKEKWQQPARDSSIQPFIFMQLAISYWIHKEEIMSLEIELKRFTQLLYVICLLGGKFRSLLGEILHIIYLVH